MRVLEVEYENLMSSAPTKVRLPRTGVVVVTGVNGAGKSTLIEAVSVGVHGRSLRGQPWWPRGAAGATKVRVVTDTIVATRTRSTSGRGALVWNLNQDEAPGRALSSQRMLAAQGEDRGPLSMVGTDASPVSPTYETTSQAQDALEAVVGEHDAWRRTCAFGDGDARFSLASDGERKRLLESLLGLERFDVALEKCRADLKRAESDWSDRKRNLDLSRGALETARRVLARSRVELDRAKEAVPPEVPPVDHGAAPSPTDVRAAQNEVTAAHQAHAAAMRHAARASAMADRATQDAAQFSDGKCPTCGQDATVVCGDRRAAATQAADDARAAAARERHAMSDVADLEWVARELVDRRRAYDTAVREQDMAMERRRRALSAVATVEREVADAEEQVAASEKVVAGQELELDAWHRRVMVLKSAEVALGLRGVRAHVLSKSLDGLTAVANAWLPRLGKPKMRVTLRPYAEKKSGGTTDAISMEVDGAGDGYGYGATSTGERRRVDVAMLLALAEVGQAARGTSRSTLFLDEVFDALDEPGVAALATALEDLSRDRAVVVVSHNPMLIDGVRAAVRIHVDGGVARVVANGTPGAQGSDP